MMFNTNPLVVMHITSPYGSRIHPVTKVRSFHNGVDLRATVNTPILAVVDGVVVVSKANNGGPSMGLGWYIVIEHNGYCTVSAHNQAQGLHVGTKVKANDIVAYSGNSGVSTAPHVHFEVRTGKHSANFWLKDSQGKYLNGVDPTSYFADKSLPEWQRVIKSKMDKPDEWIKRIEQLVTLEDVPLDKWWREFIVKLSK